MSTLSHYLGHKNNNIILWIMITGLLSRYFFKTSIISHFIVNSPVYLVSTYLLNITYFTRFTKPRWRVRGNYTMICLKWNDFQCKNKRLLLYISVIIWFRFWWLNHFTQLRHYTNVNECWELAIAKNKKKWLVQQPHECAVYL